MLIVSDNAKRAWLSGETVPKTITISFPELELTYGNSDVVSKSLSLTQRLGKNNFELGGCFASEFEIEILNLDNSVVEGVKVNVSIKAGDTEDIPLFSGEIDTIKKGGYKYSKRIIAYDWFYKAQNIDITDWYIAHPAAQTEDLMDDFFTYVGLEKGEVVWTNSRWCYCGSNGIFLPDKLTALDFLKAQCVINGGFGKIDQEGKFDIRYIPTMNPENILDIPFYKSFSMEDKSTANLIDGVIITNTDDLDYATSEASGEQYGVRHYTDSPTGIMENPYIVRANLFANEWTEQKESTAEHIYNQIKLLRYSPFSGTNLALPFVECGDWVTYADREQRGTMPIETKAIVLILERKMKGISACFDTFSARGDMSKAELQTASATSLKTAMDVANNRMDMLNQSGGGGGVTPEDLDKKMDKVNPIGSGSFSMNRGETYPIGNYSSTLGYNNQSTNDYSLAEGYGTIAIGKASHSEGNGKNKLSYSFANIGLFQQSGGSGTSRIRNLFPYNYVDVTRVFKNGSLIAIEIPNETPIFGYVASCSQRLNQITVRLSDDRALPSRFYLFSDTDLRVPLQADLGGCAGGNYAHVQNDRCTALGDSSSANGRHTIASFENEFVVGEYNDDLFADGSIPLFVVGNGTLENPSNALEVLKDGTVRVPNGDIKATVNGVEHTLSSKVSEDFVKQYVGKIHIEPRTDAQGCFTLGESPGYTFTSAQASITNGDADWIKTEIFYKKGSGWKFKLTNLDGSAVASTPIALDISFIYNKEG